MLNKIINLFSILYEFLINDIYLLCTILTGTSTSDSIAPDLYEIAEQTYIPELEGLRRLRVKRPPLCSDPYGNGWFPAFDHFNAYWDSSEIVHWRRTTSPGPEYWGGSIVSDNKSFDPFMAFSEAI